jgi:hypothetical protein
MREDGIAGEGALTSGTLQRKLFGPGNASRAASSRKVSSFKNWNNRRVIKRHPPKPSKRGYQVDSRPRSVKISRRWETSFGSSR